ncbi:hypothetical protein [Paenibacillus naphthalenovorans]|uniref:hypothetical protein n=1 Tax=Paenibacillus naphthalenovorans TaxID=162209 RepID=UPI0008829BA4|nr:hypothetical protein [Paenibacillus naphthalenovorans]SDJ76086.1 hypothetical protein SAMN05421868_1437 [Paenibacillus naphthalenovorans]
MPYNAKTNWQYDEIVTESDLNRIEQGIADAHNQLDLAVPIPITLTHGVQIITVPKTTPLNVLNIRGRTLVNLLGRDGNCEDVSKWLRLNGSTDAHSLDTTNAKYGNNAIKITIQTGLTSGGIYKNFTGVIDKSKYYILLANLKNGTLSTGIQLYFFNGGGGRDVGSQYVTGTTYTTAYVKISPSDMAGSTNNYVEVFAAGSAGQYGYVDGIRLYEISQAEYNAIDSMTPEQIAAKYPYVDDLKNIKNPYVIRYGENLLPPFTEWHASTSTFIVEEPYKVTLRPTASEQEMTYEIQTIIDQDYTISMNIPTNGVVELYRRNESSTHILSIIGDGTRKSANFTADTSKVLVKIISYESTGSYTFEKPMLNLGFDPLPFQPRSDDMTVFQTDLASNMDGTVYDSLTQRDGKLFKLSRFKTMDLDGRLPWTFYQDAAGFKRVRVDNYFSHADVAPGVDGFDAVKYDGKILTKMLTVPDVADKVWFGEITGGSDTNSDLIITISDADSGWTDAWYGTTNYWTTPVTVTPSDMLRAYFNGWKAGGGGTANWISLGDGSTSTNRDHVVNNLAPGYKPYKLQYQLAQPYEEEISTEAITLLKGLNQIEVGNGMIVREKANPVLGTVPPVPISWVYINDSIVTGSNLKNRPSKILNIYKNGIQDKRWTINSNGSQSPYLGQRAYIRYANYDPSAAYEVTYLALDQHTITCNLTQISGEYAPNLNTIVDRLALNQADIETRVSVLENTKARKVQGQWITPTLLNGWVKSDSVVTGYLKDGIGFVHIQIEIKNGTVSVPAFYLPTGYRPLEWARIPLVKADDGSLGQAIIYSDGRVVIIHASTGTFYINGMFKAER